MVSHSQFTLSHSQSQYQSHRMSLPGSCECKRYFSWLFAIFSLQPKYDFAHFSVNAQSFAWCNFAEPGHSTSSSTSVLVLTQLTKSVSLLLLVLDVIVKHEEILPRLQSKNSLILFSESSGYHCLGVAGVWWGVCISAWLLIIDTKVLRVLGAVASGGSPLHFFPIIFDGSGVQWKLAKQRVRHCGCCLLRKTITIITEKFDLNWMFQNGQGLQHCNATGSVALPCLYL